MRVLLLVCLGLLPLPAIETDSAHDDLPVLRAIVGRDAASRLMSVCHRPDGIGPVPGRSVVEGSVGGAAAGLQLLIEAVDLRRLHALAGAEHRSLGRWAWTVHVRYERAPAWRERTPDGAEVAREGRPAPMETHQPVVEEGAILPADPLAWEPFPGISRADILVFGEDG